jgi:Domain of unknown function (DUF4349)/Putative zinc-finger
MSDHAFVQENVAAFLADGLPGEERERFERHVHGCAECNRLLSEQHGFEQALGTLFADAQPRAGFEDRVLRRLRTSPARRRQGMPGWAKLLTGAAAVVFLGALGFALNTVMENGRLPFPGEWGTRAQARNELKQIGMGLHRTAESEVKLDDSDSMEPLRKVAQSRKIHESEFEAQEGLSTWPGDVRGFRDGTSATITTSKPSDGSKPLAGVDPATVMGLDGRENPTKGSMLTLTEGDAQTQRRVEDLKKALAPNGETPDVLNYKLKVTADPKAPEKELSDRFSELRDLDLSYSTKKDTKESYEAIERIGAGVKDKEVGGKYRNVPRMVPAPSDGRSMEGKGKEEPARDSPSEKTPPPPPGQPPVGQGPGMGPMGGNGVGGAGMPGSVGGRSTALAPSFSTPVAGTPVAPGYFAGVKEGDKDAKAHGRDNALIGDYFRVDLDGEGRFRVLKDLELKEESGKLAGDDKNSGKSGGKGEEKPRGEGPGKSKGDPKANQKQPDGAQAIGPAQQPKTPEPAPAARKIIRTGEIEFEIDSFDNAVAGVTKLITAIPGAFVATVNSDKLPNGKVRGSVLVRMPPEHLDKFLLDLRKDFAKIGELKNQRVGSSDVTKQYYDLESRMRAARTMEERLIDIIKKGKGEIKDLLLAERELGIWRTKLEEMEGEIRYYNNQVSLSTLTINLEEKEIRAAAAIVISEHVNMKIETDDVEKGLQIALAAVAEAKGRITKSDLKQHAAGQYEAILQFEVSPAAAPAVRDKLKTLGVVTHHDSQRLQQAEGGGDTKGEIKSRTSDVRFSVNLYNVANIEPREAYTLAIAVQDVPGDYRKLQDEVVKAKGQVRKGDLNEQDKLNIIATFHFDVPAGQRDAFDKLLSGLGDVLSRSTSQAAPGQTATDRKIGYRLTLRNLANIQPRETYALQSATLDVPAAYRDLQDEIAKLKGQIRVGNLNEQDKLNVSAQLDFDVPTAERKTIDDYLAKLGDIFSRSTNRIPPTEVATERKAGYKLTLRNLANIQPRETFTLQIAVPDVPAVYNSLQNEVAKAKGQIRASVLNEQDKFNFNAQLDFDLPTGERKTIDDMIAKLGDVVSRTTGRVAPGELSTERKAGYRLTLKSVTSIPPRDTLTLQLVSLDVPDAYRKLQDLVAQLKGHVRQGNLNEQDKHNISARFDFDVATAERESIEKALGEIGDISSRDSNRLAPNEVASDRKVGYRLTILNAAAIEPREKVSLAIAVEDVDQAANRLKDIVRDNKGSVFKEQTALKANGQVVGLFLFDVPLSAKDSVVRRFKDVGKVIVLQPTYNPKAPETKLALAHINVELLGVRPIVAADEGMWPQVRTSLSYSFRFLTWSVMLIVLGVSVLLPWALLVWLAVKLVRKVRGKPQPATAT